EPVAGTALGGTQGEDLAREVPVVERLRGVDAAVALQANRPGAERLGNLLRERRLAHPGFALEKQRAAHPQCEEGRRGQALVGQVVDSSQHRGELLWAGDV